MNHIGDTNKMVRDTPRTDAGKKIVLGGVGGDWEVVHIAFSRQLERELTAANERIKRLEEAGDYLCAAAAFMGWHDKIEAWNKAKKDKL